mgnify:FL=1
MTPPRPLFINRLFEGLIDPFRPAQDAMPPDRLTRFYAHYLRQVRGPLLLLVVVGLLSA